MKYLYRLVCIVLLALNIGAGIGYLVCAYSPYIQPVSHPYWACSGLFFPIFLAANLLFLVVWLILKRLYAPVPTIFLVLGWGSLHTYLPIHFGSDVKGGDTLRVLTYNVQAFHWGVDGDDYRILSYLKESGADIICLQEFIPSWNVGAGDIDAALSAYPYRNVTWMDGGDRLACYSRYPILSADRISYPSPYNGSVLYKLKMGADTLTLINNHLESNKLNKDDKGMYHEILTSPHEETVKEGGKRLLRKLAEAVSVRAPQADSVAAAIRRNTSRHMIICGDFNDSPISYAHRVIGDGLRDAYVATGCGPGFSYNRDFFYFRIDHLFVSKAFRVLKCEVDRSIQASDHYPVWCLLEK